MDITYSINDVPIRLTYERWFHITENHDDLASYYFEVLETVENPELIVRGNKGSLKAVKNMGKNNKLVVIYREISKRGGFILGDMDFANWVKETFLSIRNDQKEIPQLKRLKPKVSLETILEVVSDEFGCSKEMIREKGRKNNKPRGIAAYLARDLRGAICGKLGDFLPAYRALLSP